MSKSHVINEADPAVDPFTVRETEAEAFQTGERCNSECLQSSIKHSGGSVTFGAAFQSAVLILS